MKQLNFGSTNGVPNDPNKTVVHCPTQELAQKVLRIADEYGLTWSNGQAYTSYNPWGTYNSSTCYLLVRGFFLTTETYSSKGYTMLPAEEFIRLNTVEQPDAVKKNPFKIGDKVFVAFYGKGTVWDASVNSDGCFIQFKGDPIFIPMKFISFTEYTLQGFSQERPKPEIKDGQLIYVRHEDHTEWLMRFFSHFDGDDVRYFLGQQKTGKTQVAKQYSLTNPLEII